MLVGRVLKSKSKGLCLKNKSFLKYFLQKNTPHQTLSEWQIDDTDGNEEVLFVLWRKWLQMCKYSHHIVFIFIIPSNSLKIKKFFNLNNEIEKIEHIYVLQIVLKLSEKTSWSSMFSNFTLIHSMAGIVLSLFLILNLDVLIKLGLKKNVSSANWCTNLILYMSNSVFH